LILLLVIIYIIFMSFGLPSGLLGSAWPSMYLELDVPMANAGIAAMMVSTGTIISTLFSGKIIKRVNVGLLNVINMAIIAVSLFGISFSQSFLSLCLWSIPIGLSSGLIDSAINSFVAIHYKAKHMNWLHCFWGAGASIGPIIMSISLNRWHSWNIGYRITSLIQIAVVVLLICTLPLWRQSKSEKQNADTTHHDLSIAKLIALPGAKETLMIFFLFGSLESILGLWGSSYLVTIHNLTPEVAASWIALHIFGVTIGRFLSGFLAIKFTNRQLLRLGGALMVIGIIILLLPLNGLAIIAALFILGLGRAPFFPCLLHETPKNFGALHSQSIVGIEMACAYIGITLMPQLFGILATKISYSILPICLGSILLIILYMIKRMYKKTASTQ